jgi:phosphatidylserine/phosphatidylglycerophosphate/cardiolipin synthase-like enzyme
MPENFLLDQSDYPNLPDDDSGSCLERIPPIREPSLFEPLLGLEVYLQHLGEMIAQLGPSDALYISGWTFYSDLIIDTTQNIKLIDMLKNAVAQGVDVRILIWVEPYLIKQRFAPQQSNNLEQTVRLRLELGEERVAINYFVPYMGSSHIKMVVISKGNEVVTAFTGGLDLGNDRLNWHDLQVRIEGLAAADCYKTFQCIWAEAFKGSSEPLPWWIPEAFLMPDPFLQVNRIEGNLNEIETRAARIPSDTDWLSLATSRCQIVNTVARYSIYQVADALNKVISSAEDYIYIEDQFLYSRTLLQRIRERVIQNPSLKVILLMGKPNNEKSKDYRDYALYSYLFTGPEGETLTNDQIDQIGVFVKCNVYVHSKLWLVDDKWCMVGSANFSNRSLFTDIENAVACEDADKTQLLRIQLWGTHFNLPEAVRQEKLSDIQVALNIWRQSWGVDGAGIQLPFYESSGTGFEVEPESNGNILFCTCPQSELSGLLENGFERGQFLRFNNSGLSLTAVVKRVISVSDYTLFDPQDEGITLYRFEVELDRDLPFDQLSGGSVTFTYWQRVDFDESSELSFGSVQYMENVEDCGEPLE